MQYYGKPGVVSLSTGGPVEDGPGGGTPGVETGTPKY